jgi:hypothetical protein
VHLKSRVEIKTELSIEIQNRRQKENEKYIKRQEPACYCHWAETIVQTISPCARFTDRQPDPKAAHALAVGPTLSSLSLSHRSNLNRYRNKLSR